MRLSVEYQPRVLARLEKKDFDPGALWRCRINNVSFPIPKHRKLGHMSAGLTQSDLTRLLKQAESERSRLIAEMEALSAKLQESDGFIARLKHSLLSLASEQSTDSGLREAVFSRSESLPAMIARVLEDDFMEAAGSGRPVGLKPAEVTSRIERLYGCEVTGKSVNSHLWYLLSKNRVSKTGSRYYLVSTPKRPLPEPATLSERLVSANDSKAVPNPNEREVGKSEAIK